MRDGSIGRTLYCDCKNVGSNPISRQARLAQLVEQCPSKSKVIGSNPVPSKGPVVLTGRTLALHVKCVGSNPAGSKLTIAV